MKKIELVQRKAFLLNGMPLSQLNHLTQRTEYFRGREGDKAFFGKRDALLLYIGTELLNVMPFRLVGDLITDIAKNYPNLDYLLNGEIDRHMVIETVDEELVEGINLQHIRAYITPSVEVNRLDLAAMPCVLLLNLKPVVQGVVDLFEEHGLRVN